MPAARGRLLQLVVAVLVAVLASGGALSGLVSALSGPPRHVCTCATGGSHARCPICNPSLGRHAPSASPLIDGAPCGDRSSTRAAAFEPALAAAPRVEVPPPLSRSASWPVLARPFEDVSTRPAIPPPRSA